MTAYGLTRPPRVNRLRLRQNGCHFAEDILKFIFLCPSLLCHLASMCYFGMSSRSHYCSYCPGKQFVFSVATVLAPVPLSIFRSNLKFDENSKHSSVKYTRPITTIFCTRHDSVTKYRCDRSSIFETRAF